ncbi:dihydrofolate synthase/folylpolyglutamate synthase [Saccharomonospora amisosensis]|uniref:tetrahydrofolate synthase n=1 Tax=Saccharomonospora amisosensis TaxID=1128677 RepID=A0A7X5ZRJ7_9PSEU|nr:Mur ligase family protein [Saccharomonospora amisosensis]NIJ12923.1 dihydrofolate synthase/folylpolyglutamate synthase [Saccharomonospora amisosensis]
MTATETTRRAARAPIADLDDVASYLLTELPSSSGTVMTAGVGRRRATMLLSMLGSPQDSMRTVHVAGTAGKGSVSTFITALLRAHGHRVGTYLSPHAHTLLERFLLDGRPAPAHAVAAALDAVREQERVVSQGPLGQVTMFEAATVAAFRLFSERAVDYAVIETGLGGSHDATNTVTRSDKLAVITAIGLDHTAVLGDTLPEIARQKAGILPRAGTAFASRGAPEVAATLDTQAALRDCRLEQLASAELAACLPAGLQLAMPGEHQRTNAGLAVRAVRHLAARDGWRLEQRRTEQALREARLPGRWERRHWHGHPVILDGAHNAMKLASLADTVERRWPGRAPVWVLACKQGKDLLAGVAALARNASAVVAAQFRTGGQHAGPTVPAPAAQVAAAAVHEGVRVIVAPSLPDALRRAVAISQPDLPVIVTGSFHAVAEAGRVTRSVESP